VISRNNIQDFFKSHNPDVLCLNETKVDDVTLQKLRIKQQIPDEYSQYWNCCKPPKKGYAGTALFSKGIVLWL